MSPAKGGEEGAAVQEVLAEPAEDASTMEVMNHLLFHKALISESDDGSRLGEYLRMLGGSEEAEHYAIRDPFNRAIAMAFELVIQEHMDPWKIDLVRFAQLYLERFRAEEKGGAMDRLDLVTAGRILLMAWTVLKLQSDRLVAAAEAANAPPPAEEFSWDSLPEWNLGDPEWEYTQRVVNAPIAPIDEKVRHKADRKVTLMELLSALEEARTEAVEYQKLADERRRARDLLAAKGRASVEGMMHTDDPEADQEIVWQRILTGNGSEIPLTDLYPEGNLNELVTAFNSVLFLAAAKRVWLRQEEFPRGPILITNLERAEVHPAELEARRAKEPRLASRKARVVPADVARAEEAEEGPEEE